MLRAGGYFAWAAQPVYKHEEAQQEAWKGISFRLSSKETPFLLTNTLCLVGKLLLDIASICG